jgi:DNA helicase-2/ATP-dependent DNA helicase PcrA
LWTPYVDSTSKLFPLRRRRLWQDGNSRPGFASVDNDQLAQVFRDSELPVANAEDPAQESTREKVNRGLRNLLDAPWAEVGLYRNYLEGRSQGATHQVVKGSEFEHVMVVMDDQEAGGFMFSYDKLFGAVPLSENDQANAAEKKETSIDRTLRLLNVTCSRAKESLALVLWSSDPDAALASIKAGRWFTDTEILRIPGT